MFNLTRKVGMMWRPIGKISLRKTCLFRFIYPSENGLLLISISMSIFPEWKVIIWPRMDSKDEKIKKGWRPPPLFMGLSCFLMDGGLYLSLLSKGNSTREGEKSWAKVDLLLEEVINICSKKGLDTEARFYLIFLAFPKWYCMYGG